MAFAASAPSGFAAPGTAPRRPSIAGLTLVVLLHVAVVLLLLQHSERAPLARDREPVSERLMTVFTIAAPTAADIRPATPPAMPARPDRPKPIVRRSKPTPSPPKPTALTAPAPVALAAPTTAEPPPADVAASDTPAPPGSTSAAAAPASREPAPGEIGAQRTTLSAGETDRLARQYAGVISRTISSSQKWPLMSRQRGETGTAWVRLKLARDGRVIDATLIRPTGYPRLDEEARAVIFRIGRFMPVPSRLRPDQEYLLLDQPMRFGPA